MIDNAFGKFPKHMHLVRNVFTFSHHEAAKVMLRFQNNADLLGALDHVIKAVSDSDLPEADKAALVELIAQEKDVLSFSVTARSSVVAL